jgi:hypothetical protein
MLFEMLLGEVPKTDFNMLKNVVILIVCLNYTAKMR